MDTAGLVMVLIGIYLLTSAIKNRRPIELAKAVITNPTRTKTLTQSAEGYEPQSETETGPPRFFGGGAGTPTETPTQSDNPSMALVNPKPTGSSVEKGLQPTARTGLQSVAAAFPILKSFGGRASRPGNYSDHPRGLAVDFMIPGWNTKAGNALGWNVAHYVQRNASALRVKYIIWDVQTWSPGGSWHHYTHPSGATDPTSSHKNHVHVSFKG